MGINESNLTQLERIMMSTSESALGLFDEDMQAIIFSKAASLISPTLVPGFRFPKSKVIFPQTHGAKTFFEYQIGLDNYSISMVRIDDERGPLYAATIKPHIDSNQNTARNAINQLESNYAKLTTVYSDVQTYIALMSSVLNPVAPEEENLVINDILKKVHLLLFIGENICTLMKATYTPEEFEMTAIDLNDYAKEVIKTADFSVRKSFNVRFVADIDTKNPVCMCSIRILDCITFNMMRIALRQHDRGKTKPDILTIKSGVTDDGCALSVIIKGAKSYFNPLENRALSPSEERFAIYVIKKSCEIIGGKFSCECENDSLCMTLEIANRHEKFFKLYDKKPLSGILNIYIPLLNYIE